MFAKMARGTFLLMIAVMVVAWAFSLNKSDASAPHDEQPEAPWSVYC